MQRSHSFTGLLRSVLTNRWRPWLLWAAWLAAGLTLFIFSPVCLFSAEPDSPARNGTVALRAETSSRSFETPQDKAQPTPTAQDVKLDEDETLDGGPAIAQVDGEALPSGLDQGAEALGPTPTPKSEPYIPSGQPEEVEAPQTGSEAPAERGEAPWEEPAAPPAAPEEPASATQAPPAPGCPTASMSGFALALFNAINDERTQRGLPALAAHGCVAYVAQLRASDMAIRSSFSHTGPDGETAFSLMDQYGVPYGWAGENIASNTDPDGETVAVAIRTLMESEPHRANILSANFTHLGVGAAVDASGMKYFSIVLIG